MTAESSLTQFYERNDKLSHSAYFIIRFVTSVYVRVSG